MKLKKEIIVACCVIIACLGIVLTGCGNGSGDTDAESNTEKYVEDSGDADVENNTDGTYHGKKLNQFPFAESQGE